MARVNERAHSFTCQSNV